VTGGSLALVLATFLASAVEAVEALTIVLAVGVTRGWRSTLLGVLAAVTALAALVVVVGPRLTDIPVDVLRLVVGTLLLAFGLQWLRKAILRASGLKEIHDEVAAFAREAAAAREAAPVDPDAFDGYAFALAFKGVLLEGIEVVFIVLTFGAAQGRIGLAAVGAAVALVVVVVVGLAVRAPLARVPENSLKLVVGILLTSFGVFWSVEGAGASWPGDDLAIPVIVAALGLYALVASALLRRRAPAAAGTGAP
jgi:MYXO-CTERM domain-containing protein